VTTTEKSSKLGKIAWRVWRYQTVNQNP